MIDAVLLDWEGVLVDTAAAREAALAEALEAEGTTVERLAHDAPLRDLVSLRASRAFQAALSRGVTLRPGAHEFVEQVQSHSRLGICALATRDETLLALEVMELWDATAVIVVAGDVANAPPHGDLFVRAIEQLSRLRAPQVNRVLALANSKDMVRAAGAAGISTVALDTPAHVSLMANAALDSLEGISLRGLATLARFEGAGHQR